MKVNENKISEEEIVLAPQTELFEEAKEIARSSASNAKFPFVLHYDVNQKEFLLSVLQTVGANVEAEDDDGHTLDTLMNMRQLAFVKRLDCVERVSTDEGSNPFVAEEAIANETRTAAPVERMATLDLNETELTSDSEEGIATASVNSRCTTNTDMASAKNVQVENSASGCICCPGAEEWFKFTVPEAATYTIYTLGTLDTAGTLYNSDGNQLAEVDDYEPCGKLNFRIIRDLVAGETYYVKVTGAKGGTGDYYFRVTKDALAESVTINKNTIILEKGVTYELPMTFDTEMSSLSVSVSPDDTAERKIYWTKSGDVLQLTYTTEKETGIKHTYVVGIKEGEGELYAEDWDGDGCKSEKCSVLIRTREKITVKRDGNFNKIVFENSGKVWQSINYDLINNWRQLDQQSMNELYSRLCANTYETPAPEWGSMVGVGPKHYTQKEMRILYILDPLGMASYIQHYGDRICSDLADGIRFKDSVFFDWFGRAPKYYARTKQGEWYDATDEKETLAISKVLSESELLFGSHPIYDYCTMKEIFATVLQILSLPVSLAPLAHLKVSKVYCVFLKFMNLTISIGQAILENDFVKLVEALQSATEMETETETKSGDYNLNWAKDLFKLSENFEALHSAIADKPSFYKELLEFCANNEDYQILFEYNGGQEEDAASIYQKIQ